MSVKRVAVKSVHSQAQQRLLLRLSRRKSQNEKSSELQAAEQLAVPFICVGHGAANRWRIPVLEASLVLKDSGLQLMVLQTSPRSQINSSHPECSFALILIQSIAQ